MEDLVNEITRLRARVLDLEDRLHERDLAVSTLAHQVADRDDAWERSVRLNYDQTFGLDVDGFIVVVRRSIQSKRGGA